MSHVYVEKSTVFDPRRMDRDFGVIPADAPDRPNPYAKWSPFFGRWLLDTSLIVWRTHWSRREEPGNGFHSVDERGQEEFELGAVAP
jgi:hypothetical protein